MVQTAPMQSSRELVKQRRRAMSTMGRAALNTKTARTAATAARYAAAPASGTSASTTSSRAASIARRAAMSSSGKAAITSRDRTRGGSTVNAPVAEASAAPNAVNGAEPKKGCGCGCDGTRAECKTQMAREMNSGGSAPLTNTQMGSARMGSVQADVAYKPAINMPVARAASVARREALSQHGKAGLISAGGGNVTTTRPAAAVSTADPNLSDRDVAMAKRAQRSQNGAGEKIARPCGRMRRRSSTGAAQEAPWKVGASETTHGQIITGTMTGRSSRVTGDEPSTCRAITGTEYLGADAVRDFCQAQPMPGPDKVDLSTTSRGNFVSGNKIGRGFNMTGNEAGGCHRVTGNEYIGTGEAHTFCGTPQVEPGPSKITSSQTRKGKTLTGDNIGRSDSVTGDEHGAQRDPTGAQYAAPGDGKAPAKVGMSKTLRGGGVTGTMVGRGKRVTGDEHGSCKDVTGDDYIGQEQYNGFCKTMPRPTDFKSGVSKSHTGKYVTGTLTGRSMRVTGDEPGSCKTLTGTPYASADQFETFCNPYEAAMASARRRRLRSTPGMPMTGLQPGINGVLTGARRGACEPVSGTPYVGADQYAQACPATAADPASPDFPQSLDGSAPWQQFSVQQPSGGAQPAPGPGGVTGTRYESGRITGSFGKGEGKLTGTEEARFDHQQPEQTAFVSSKQIQGRVVPRISGEGQDTGLTITGDDWDRNKHVTGTEGLSATRRNPTRREGNVTAMAVAQKRNETMTKPTSKVTGGSGNTEKGSLITYSGGARG